MTTIRQIASEASEILSSQSVSVEDIVQAANILGISIGNDGGDPADPIAALIAEIVQVAIARQMPFIDAVNYYSQKRQSSAPTAPAKKKKGGKQSAKFQESVKPPVEAEQDARSLTTISQVHDAYMAGVLKALQQKKAEQQGAQLVHDLVAGIRQPANEMEQAILAQAQGYELPSATDQFLSLSDGEITLNCDPGDLTLESAFESVTYQTLRLADFDNSRSLPAGA